MSHGTSDHAIPTHASRGTGGYRAPELVADIGHFTNKVDIWAFGCILFELITGTKAFLNDWAVREYYQTNSSKDVVVPEYPPLLQCQISQILIDLFQRDPETRPRSEQLFFIFDAYSAVSDPCIALSLDSIASYPTYKWLKEIVRKGAGRSVLSARSKIAEWYTENQMHPIAILLLEQAVCQSSGDDGELLEQLDLAYLAQRDGYSRVLGWSEMLKRNPTAVQLRRRLVRACRELEEPGIHRVPTSQERLTLDQSNPSPHAVHEGREMYWWDEIICEQVDLVKMDEVSEIAGLWCREVAALRKYCDWRGDVDKAIAVWKSLVACRPSATDIHAELKRACDLKGDVDATILVWEDLVCQLSDYVGFQTLFDNLYRAVEAKGNQHETFRELERIVKKRPNITPIFGRLANELRMSDDADVRLDVWKRILFANPENPDFQAEVRCILKSESTPNLFNNVIAEYLSNTADAVVRLDEATWLELELASAAPWNAPGVVMYLLFRVRFGDQAVRPIPVGLVAWLLGVDVLLSSYMIRLSSAILAAVSAKDVPILVLCPVCCMLSLVCYCMLWWKWWVGFSRHKPLYVVTLIYSLKLGMSLRH